MLNISTTLYQSNWTNLVFKNRNKAYGAYELRAQSSSITVRALFIAAPLFIFLFVGPLIYKRLFPVEIEQAVPVTAVVDLVLPPVNTKLPEKKVELPKADPSAEKLKTVKMTANIKVVEQPDVDETPPSLEQLKDAVVGQVTQTGKATQASAVPEAAAGPGTGIGVSPAPDNNVYETGSVEKYPEFEGGMAAWAKFIQRNLRYPEQATEEGIQGKVFVSFVIERDGSITDVTILKGIGGGCDEESLRVIKKSPRWKPGMQHNNPVRVRYTMPLSFTLN
ncbi:energy transducer TonB [Pedobacter sp. L105]|uniref:energy transducer TonB n=1 Tax=Pedobacter sp. L105 TaxID=1641871 RepID=UPI00131DAB22|nr:energy transducer TonB [Pedobacter sp. L105]